MQPPVEYIQYQIGTHFSLEDTLHSPEIHEAANVDLSVKSPTSTTSLAGVTDSWGQAGGGGGDATTVAEQAGVSEPSAVA